MIAYKDKKFPVDYIPTVMDNYTTEAKVKGKSLFLEIWDTTGQETYQEIRKLSYSRANVILMCYDVVNVSSFKNLANVWKEELCSEAADAPFIICGNKLDLTASSPQYVTEEDADEMREKIGAYASVQCSAQDYTDDNSKGRVEEVFATVIECGLENISDSLEKKCVLM